MATININIPDGVLSALGSTTGDRERFALEATVIECYRDGRLSQAQCCFLLDIPVGEFLHMLGERQVPHPLTTQDLVEGYQAIGKLFPK